MNEEEGEGLCYAGATLSTTVHLPVEVELRLYGLNSTGRAIVVPGSREMLPILEYSEWHFWERRSEDCVVRYFLMHAHIRAHTIF